MARNTLLCIVLVLVLLPQAALGLAQDAPVPDDPADEPAPEATESGEAQAEYSFPADVVEVKAEPEVGFEPGQEIDLSLRDADLVEVLRAFAVDICDARPNWTMGDFNMVIDPSVEGSVTVELKDTRWEDALVMILRVNGLGAEVDGKLWSVHPVTKK